MTSAHTVSLILNWVAAIEALIIVALLVILMRRLQTLRTEIRSQLTVLLHARTCASCGTVIEPTGSPPVEVQEHVTALVGRGPIPVRFYICQTCAALPEGATA